MRVEGKAFYLGVWAFLSRAIISVSKERNWKSHIYRKHVQSAFWNSFSCLIIS